MPLAKANSTKNAQSVDSLPPDDVLFGRSAAMAAVRQRAAKVCDANVPVLLWGDGGTGKEALARWIHKNSSNCTGQFVKVNCAAIPGSLLESELFGYEKGAFTGANTSKPGRVELAHQGTLFLDEIADLDAGLQSKLLQFLQDGRFSRIGGQEERLVETRLLCATNKDLQQEVDAGTFRADLYFRINVVRIRLPRLQERSEDIPLLAEYFRTQFQEKFSKPTEPLSRETLQYLKNLEWPGNTRELSNVIARHVLIGAETKILQEHVAKRSATLPKALGKESISLKQIAKEAIRTRERDYILGALQANQWNRRKTAEALKISYRTLIYKIRNAGFATKRTKHSCARQEDQVDQSHFPSD
ncbi:MAG TPA: sigma-54 dependent transcriptional regulator [Methylomirabilota bacterium]|nr:sigma-54 dependent transcriptional regulator [Methylomirabilota bacterium]